MERPLSATLAWNYPTVEVLVAYLADTSPALAAAEIKERTPRHVEKHSGGNRFVRRAGSCCATRPRERARNKAMNNPADAHTTMSAVKLALMAKQMRAQAETALRADPIAIIGMACRVPGDGDTPELLWRRYAPVSTRSGKFPPTVGMAMPGMIPTYRLQENRSQNGVDFLTVSMPLMRNISAFFRARRSGWIHNSGCCSKWRSRRSTAPVCRMSGSGDPYGRLHRELSQRLRAASTQRHRRHRAANTDRHATQRACQSSVLFSRPTRS